MGHFEKMCEQITYNHQRMIHAYENRIKNIEDRIKENKYFHPSLKEEDEENLKIQKEALRAYEYTLEKLRRN